MAEGAVTIEPDGRIYVKLGASDDEVRDAGRVIFNALSEHPKLLEKNRYLTEQRNLLLSAIITIQNGIEDEPLKVVLSGVIAKCAMMEPKNELPKEH